VLFRLAFLEGGFAGRCRRFAGLNAERDDLLYPELFLRVPAGTVGRCLVPSECEAVLVLRSPVGRSVHDVAKGAAHIETRNEKRLVGANLGFGSEQAPEYWLLELEEVEVSRRSLGDSALSWHGADTSPVLERWRRQWWHRPIEPGGA